MNKIKIFSGFISLALGLSSPLCHADVGGDGSGGGFMDHNGRKILQATLAELNAYIPWTETATFKAHPERREVVEQALQTLQIKSTESRTRAHQPLVMDYDIAKLQIVALRPFFEGFMTASVNNDSIRAAEALILHEIAHLWGDGEDDADRFAAETLQSSGVPGGLSDSPSGLCDDVQKGRLVTLVPADAQVMNDCIDAVKNRWCSIPDPFPAGDSEKACAATAKNLRVFGRELSRCESDYTTSSLSRSTEGSVNRAFLVHMHIAGEEMRLFSGCGK